MISEQVRILLHEVANNADVSTPLVDELQPRLKLMRRKYLNLVVSAFSVAYIPMVASRVADQLHWLPSKPLTGLPTTVAFSLLGFVIYWRGYSAWRAQHSDTYIASYLLNALDAGIKFSEKSNDAVLRDNFAQAIQRVAWRYKAIYKRSESSRFFKAHVKRVAQGCRTDIMSLVPGIVTASKEKLDGINRDLARLIIRSQTDYWHETGDLRRSANTLTRSNRIAVSFTSFFRERPIQVAIIALIGALMPVIVALVNPHVHK